MRGSAASACRLRLAWAVWPKRYCQRARVKSTS